MRTSTYKADCTAGPKRQPMPEMYPAARRRRHGDTSPWRHADPGAPSERRQRTVDGYFDGGAVTYRKEFPAPPAVDR